MKVTLKIAKMHCASCSILIDTVLEELPGVTAAKTSYAQQKVDVEFDEAKVDTQRMISAIKSEGYEATV